MADTQPKLLNSVNHLHVPDGPIFEAGPGWGFKIKKWLNKNFFRKVLPAITVLVLVFGLFLFFKNYEKTDKNKRANTNIITQTVLVGDSKTLVTRRALVSYLEKFPESLSNGQKVFIEETLRKMISGNLAANMRIEFKTEDIKTAIDKSLRLSPAQLEKWGEYAKNVKF